MFILKKVISPFFLPPGCFIILIIISGLYIAFRKKNKSGFFVIFIGFFLWGVSLPIINDLAMMPLVSGLEIPKNPKGDVIILLGGGIDENADDITGKGVPHRDLMGRILTAARLWKQINIPIIVSGGKVFNMHLSEAQVVKRFLHDLGIPENMVILEENSRDTFENAIYTKKILEKKGFKKPILVTSDYHMKRSVICFRLNGLETLPVPAGIRKIDLSRYNFRSLLPHGYGLLSQAIHEYQGILYYAISK